MPRRAAPLLLALAVGCRPSLARLERGHHYDEAICGAAESAFPEEQVAKVIRRALDPAVHVAVVPREQLAAALGDAAPELDSVALLRITHDSNTIPLDRFDATFALRRGGEAAELQPSELATFAAVFKEHVPGPRTVGPGAVETAAHTIGTIGAVVLTVASLGLLGGLLRSRGPAPRSRTVYPTDQEIRAAAPRATRLFDAVAHLQTRHCTDQPGATCRTLALVPRPPEEPADLALEVRLRYSALCSWSGIRDDFTIPLPPGPTLEARLAAAFGQDLRRLSELRPAAR